jgi:tetratricopeptide (TPR) repeat protein
LGDAYRYLPAGDKSKNLRRAIECYEAALTVYTSQASPYDYAGTQNSLGAAYTNLPTGDRTENLRRAIGCYKAALTIYTPQTTPLEYARTQSNLGSAYADLPMGDQTDWLRHLCEGAVRYTIGMPAGKDGPLRQGPDLHGGWADGKGTLHRAPRPTLCQQ